MSLRRNRPRVTLSGPTGELLPPVLAGLAMPLHQVLNHWFRPWPNRSHTPAKKPFSVVQTFQTCYCSIICRSPEIVCVPCSWCKSVLQKFFCTWPWSPQPTSQINQPSATHTEMHLSTTHLNPGWSTLLLLCILFPGSLSTLKWA